MISSIFMKIPVSSSFIWLDFSQYTFVNIEVGGLFFRIEKSVFRHFLEDGLSEMPEFLRI